MNKLDDTLSEMSNTRFLSTYKRLISQYSLNSMFTSAEITRILMIYYKFLLMNRQKGGGMSKKQFQQFLLCVFQLNDIEMVNRVLVYVSRDASFITPEAWLELIAVYYSDNTNVRIKFAFQVYNSNGLGYLSRKEVSLAVEKFFIGDDEDEVNELRADMLDFLFSKFDKDKDNVINFEEYAASVKAQPQLLEFLGRIFPTEQQLILFATCVGLTSYLQKFR